MNAALSAASLLVDCFVLIDVASLDVAGQSRKVVLERWVREVKELGLEIHFLLKVRFEGEISSPKYDLCGLGNRSG